MTSTLKVFGPPGCGKTHYLLDRFEEELKRTRPDRIAFLTFTRAASKEALIRSKCSPADLPFLRTIHAVCYRHLGILPSQLMKPRDLKLFGQRIGAPLSGSQRDPWQLEGIEPCWEKPAAADILLQLNHLGRHRQIQLKESIKFADEEIGYKYARWFTLAYRDWKDAEGLYDFTDLLSEYLDHGQPLDIDVLFIDEAQDLSLLQWDVVRKLGANAARVYMAGDDDQAIFSWAGADARQFIDYPADREIVLGQSYRLPAAIHRVATQIAGRIVGRREKLFAPRAEEGEFRPVGFLDPTILRDQAGTFVLFRNHFRGRKLAAELEELAWPFHGESSVLDDPMVVAALEGWRHVIVDGGDSFTPYQARSIVEFAHGPYLAASVRDLLRRRDLPAVDPSAIFATTPEPDSWPMTLRNLPKIDYLVKAKNQHGWGRLLKPDVSIGSIHQSKGREASTVILDLEQTRKTYDSFLSLPEDEHRVWYVGATRARNRLFTLLPTSDWSYPI